jgi:hypothetical protein
LKKGVFRNLLILKKKSNHMKRVYFKQFKRNQIAFPNYCPCCGDASDLSTHQLYNSYRAPADESDSVIHGRLLVERSIDIPYCNHCIKHAEKNDSLSRYFLAAFTFLLGFVVPGWIGAGRTMSDVLFIGFCIGAVVVFFWVGSYNSSRAVVMKKTTCSQEDWAVSLEYDCFVFYNDKYAGDLADLNNIRAEN